MQPLRLAIFSWYLFLPTLFAQQPMQPEQQAEVALVAAQKAYNEGNFPFAAQRYTEIIQKFGNTRSAVAARFGLGVIQLNSPEQDFAKAIENLNGPANDGGFADRGQAMYHLAIAQRGLGLKELEQAIQKPNEAAQRKQTANQKFGEALRWFNSSRDWFHGQKQPDWAGRSRADQAEMELRMGRIKEARNIAEPFTKDPELAKNKYRPLGLYYFGLACYLDNDRVAAGRTLNQLAPFNDPSFGMHARYLVGRVLHQSGETAEASVHYEAIIAEYEKAKKEAATTLQQQQEKLKNNPFERQRLVALAQGPTPEYVAGAVFHSACLSYEAGKFGDALTKFANFSKTYPNDLLAPDAALRSGFCMVQLKQYEDAGKALTPVLEKTPRLADQAQFWLGKAQLGLAQQADPAKLQERDAKFKTALDSIRKGAEKAQQFTQQNDPDAKQRRHEMLLELADGMTLFNQHKEAAQVFEQLWNEQALPTRREEILQRLALAHGAGGNIPQSDNRCEEFKRTYPQSVLTPAILFRSAENAYSRALASAKAKAGDVKQRYEEATGKFKEIVMKYPEFERVNHARYGQGVCLIHTGNLEDAVKVLEAIPAPERNGDLAGAAYLLADCLIRQAPVKAEDALQENQIREKLNAALGLLDGFASANPKSDDAPLALLKLGFCYKRLGSTLADPNERNQTLQKARETYEKIEKEFGKTPYGAQATIEKAKVKAFQGDRGGAMNDLRAVLANAATNPLAPLAAVNLATLHREQNQPQEAVKVMDEARKKYEGELGKDPARAEWVQLLRYHHGVAILETNKATEARPIFEQIVREAPGKPIGAEAALRSGQSRIIEGKLLITTGTNERNGSGNDQNKKNAAQQKINNGRNAINEAGDQLLQRADQFRQALPNAESRSRMMYDAAWAFRELAQEEIQNAREELRKQAHAKLVEAAKAQLPPNSPAPNIPIPEVDRTKIPVQRFEQRAFDSYKKLTDEYVDTALSVDARFEWAEMRAERGEFDEAIKLLKDALDKEPADRPVPPETLERIRLRLGACLFSKNDYPGAAIQFETVAGNPKSQYLAQALYRAGESLFAQGEFAKAAEKLTPFRDKNEFHNVGGISDRAMLRLGQALVADKKADPGRQAFEVMLQRFGNNNPFATEARYGIGSAFASQGKHDEAIRAFEQVIAATKSELAAQAQIQIGLCKLAQGKHADAANAFLVVPLTYEYKELGFTAKLEAARANEEAKNPTAAIKLLEELLKETPAESVWNKSAKERLAKLKK